LAFSLAAETLLYMHAELLMVHNLRFNNVIVLNTLNYSAKFLHHTYQNYPFATSNFFTARTI